MDTPDPRYNLVFAGQLLPDTDRERAQNTLAGFFGLKDPAAVALFFSGRPVPLRRNLSHGDALRLYRELRGLGLICEVVAVDPAPAQAQADSSEPAQDEKPAAVAAPEPAAAPPATTEQAREPDSDATAEQAGEPEPDPTAPPVPQPKSGTGPNTAPAGTSADGTGKQARRKGRKKRGRKARQKSAAAARQVQAAAGTRTDAQKPADASGAAQESAPADAAAKASAPSRPRTSPKAGAASQPRPDASLPTEDKIEPPAQVALALEPQPAAQPGTPARPSPKVEAQPARAAAPAPEADPGPQVSAGAAPLARSGPDMPPPSAPRQEPPQHAPGPAAATPARARRPATGSSGQRPDPPRTPPSRPAAKPAAAVTRDLQIESPRSALTARHRKPMATNRGPTEKPPAAAATQRRGSVPNLFALRPGHAPQSPRALRETAQLRAFIAGAIALTLCVVVLAVALRFPAAPPGAEPRGPLAAAGMADNRLLLMVPGALLLHARSGLAEARIPAADLGLAQLAPPLWVGPDNQVLLTGTDEVGDTRLYRCALEERRCAPFIAASTRHAFISITASFLGDSYFLLSADGSLLRSSPAGEITAEATVQLPWGEPRLLASDGLLLLPAADGPLLGVYRPDQAQFGQQLDALLLMPAAAIAANQNRIRDIALTGDRRWAILAGDESAAALFAFDRQWGNGQRITLPDDFSRPYLIRWRDKLLVADAQSMRLARFSAEGNPEAAFASTLLAEERENWLRVSRQRALLRHAGVVLPLCIAVLCALLAALYAASYQALGSWPEQRTALLDPLPAGVCWLPDAKQREQHIRMLGILLVSLALLPMVLLALTGSGRSALMMLPATIAGFYAWAALRRGSGGHLGTIDGRFIAVNGEGRYFYGERSLLRGRPEWLLAPTVAVPVALPLLSNIDALEQTREGNALAPAARSTVVELLGILWQMRHPWLMAAIAVVAGWLLTGIALLLLAG